MDNLNQGNESDAIREKANILNDKIVQNTETSVTGGGHLPPTRKNGKSDKPVLCLRRLLRVHA